MGQRENIVQRACLQLLSAAGIFAHRNNSGAFRTKDRFVRFGAVGSPDIVGILPGGQYIGVEAKAKGGRQSEMQKEYQRQVENAGGVYLLVHDSKELEEWLKANGRL